MTAKAREGAREPEAGTEEPSGVVRRPHRRNVGERGSLPAPSSKRSARRALQAVNPHSPGSADVRAYALNWESYRMQLSVVRVVTRMHRSRIAPKLRRSFATGPPPGCGQHSSTARGGLHPGGRGHDRGTGRRNQTTRSGNDHKSDQVTSSRIRRSTRAARGASCRRCRSPCR